MSTAAKINPRILDGTTAQGTYVFAADGTAYGFNNNRSVERLNAMLDKGLEAFSANPPKTVNISKELIDEPWGRTPEKDTSVLRVFTRIRPVPEGAPDSNKMVARDHVWILAGEVEYLVKNNAVPNDLAMRLARFHFVDNVRGEPDMWQRNEVEKAEFTVRKLSGGKLALSGTFSMQTKDSKRGVQGKLDAELTISNNLITRFRGYAQGFAWGVSTYTQGAPEGRFPIAWAFVETNDATSKVVPPQAAFFGSVYFKAN